MLACLVQESLNFRRKPAEKTLDLPRNDPQVKKPFYVIRYDITRIFLGLYMRTALAFIIGRFWKGNHESKESDEANS